MQMQSLLTHVVYSNAHDTSTLSPGCMTSTEQHLLLTPVQFDNDGLFISKGALEDIAA